MVEHRGSLEHLNHKCGLAVLDIIASPDARKHAVNERGLERLRRHPQPHVRHDCARAYGAQDGRLRTPAATVSVWTSQNSVRARACVCACEYA